MHKFTASNVMVDVSDPYPCWIHITQGDRGHVSIPHTEIGDLIAMLQRAQHAAKRQLSGTHAHEAD